MSLRGVAGIVVAMVVFFLSLVIAPYYVGGDQHEYIKVYTNIADMNVADAYRYYSNWTGGQEYIHFFLIWLASGWGIEKDLFISFVNGLLAYSVMRLFEQWRVSILVAMATVLSNFYMVMMYFAAERLKFGFFFLVISLLYVNSKKRFYPLAALAVLAHAQTIMIYGSVFFARVAKAALRYLRSFKISFTFKGLILPLLMIVPIILLAQHTLFKIEYYQKMSAGRGAADFLRIILLLVLSLWYSKTKKETILLFVPLMLAISVVGGDRVNMIGYFIFLYYGLQYKGGVNFGVLATTAYFSLKSYTFVSDIIEYGDGFATIVGQLDAVSRLAHV